MSAPLATERGVVISRETMEADDGCPHWLAPGSDGRACRAVVHIHPHRADGRTASHGGVDDMAAVGRVLGRADIMRHVYVVMPITFGHAFVFVTPIPRISDDPVADLAALQRAYDDAFNGVAKVTT